MSNAFLNETVYAKTMLLMAKNELVMGKLVDGQYKNEINDENGLTVNVKRPPRFARNDATSDYTNKNSNFAAQDVVIGSIPVTVDQFAKVHLSFGDIESVQSVNDLMKNSSMKSAASTLAHQIDNYLAQKTLQFPNWIAGTAAGTLSGNAADPTKMIGSSAQAQAAFTRLQYMGVPTNDLAGILNPDDGQAISGSLTGSFLTDIARPALEESAIPMLGKVKFYSTQQCPSYTTGTRAQGDGSSTGVQVNGASQNVNYRDVKSTNTQTLLVKTLSTNTIVQGDVFTIQNVYAWDWRNNAKLGYLQQFTVVGATQTGDGSGHASLTISPPIIVQGSSDGTSTAANTAFATVDSVPADSAYIKFAGAASTVLQVRSAWNKSAITMVSTPLRMPATGIAAQIHDKETGISIRYWRGSDFSTGVHGHRWDCVFGAVVTDPLMGTRVCGT